MCFCKIRIDHYAERSPCIIFYFALFCLFVSFSIRNLFKKGIFFLISYPLIFKNGFISNHRNKSQAGNLQSCKELKIISRKHSCTRNKNWIPLSQITETGLCISYCLIRSHLRSLLVLTFSSSCQNASETTGWVHVFWRLKMGGWWKPWILETDSSCVLLTPNLVRILTAKSFRFV